MQATSYAFMVAYQYVFHCINEHRLWFDVGIEEYTTVYHHETDQQKLWFDVGREEYTTDNSSLLCGTYPSSKTKVAINLQRDQSPHYYK